MGKCNANTERLRGYRIEIYPTEEQKKVINRKIDLYRAVYNLARGLQEQEYIDNGGFIDLYDMNKRISDLKETDEYSWIQELSIGCARQALLNLNVAYMKFFKGVSRHPKFKSKKTARKTLGVRSERCISKENYIHISGLPAGMHAVYAKNHPIPIGVRMYNTVVSFDGYRYWFSCQVEKPMIDMSDIPQTDIIGVDVGINPMMVTSDGSRYHFPDNSKLEKRRRREDKRLSKHRKKYLAESIHTKTKYEDLPKSKNYEKLLKKYNKTRKKISHRNMNAVHNATKDIVSKNPAAIVIETVYVQSMMKEKWFAKHAPQACFYEMHRQIKYKAADRGIPVIQAEPNFPSSQMCSRCGVTHKVYRNKRFRCPSCGLRIDRDLNASINLREYGRSIINSNIEVA